MTLTTRKPTGLPSWPIMLLAGIEKAGKSYACAEASASDLIGRTIWIGVGEDEPDELGAIEGADFEIVEHDGTYRSILGTLTAAVAEPKVDGKPTLLVLDSGGRVWTLLSDQAQATANERAARKGKAVSDDGAVISMDLWNAAKQRWGHILDVLRSHDGPVIITARLDHTVVVDDRGEPTKEKTWKVQAEKNLPFDVGVIVQLRAFGEAYLTGVRSLRYRPTPAELTPIEDFTVDALWRRLGLADDVGPRSHSPADGQVTPDGERIKVLQEIKAEAERLGIDLQTIADDWAATHDKQAIGEATDLGGLELLRDDLAARPTPKASKE